ncbi:MAG: sigma 54-interacting transcriptional regulator [Desulfuromonadales bacterium]|nr:sigma 54-interacting transcriptional regulator [Desulfuromonadales bacterium]
MTQRILVVDDEESIRFTFDAFLTEAGYTVHSARSLSACLKKIDQQGFDLIFMDIMLGRDSGLEALRECKKRLQHTPVVMITGAPEVHTAAEAMRGGAFDYVPKPLRQETLLRVTRVALEHKNLLDQQEQLRSRLQTVFASVKEGIFVFDEELRIVDANDAAFALFECCPQVIGRLLSELNDKELAGLNEIRHMLESRCEGEIFRFEMPSTSGQTKVFSLTMAALVAERSSALSGIVMTARDETRLDALERSLEQRQRFDKMVGKSRAMQDVYKLVDTLADIDTTVLISGESGTGKELIAESLHFRGPRRDAPLVKVNCAALPDNLLESELFGHVKGAFTSAMSDRVGRFQQAHGGTIFLDEIGDISPALQVRLLRVLQEKEFERVGSNATISVDVRIVAASNRSLLEQVKSGAFREDLYYRLKVIEIKAPALRARKSDIPLLVNHFIDEFNSKFHRSVAGLSRQALQLLIDYNWPGNVRELQHVLEHAFILCRDTVLSVEHLPGEFQEMLDAATSASVVVNEKDRILAVLDRTGWNKSRAADLMGISRRTIYRKIEEFGINAPG